MMITERPNDATKDPFKGKISNRKMVYKMSVDKETIQNQLVKRRQARTFTLPFVSLFQSKIHDGLYARKLVSLLRSSKKTKTFNLDYSGFGPRDLNDAGSTRLSQHIKTCRSLRSFDMQFSGTIKSTVECLLSIGQALKRLPSLKYLTFEISNVMKLTALGVSHFVQSLKRIPLQGLQINWTDFFFDFGPALSALGRSLKRSSSMKTIDINYSSQGCNDNIALPLFEALAELSSLESISLVLPSQDITDEGIGRLSNALKSKTALKKLKLDFKNCQGITQKGVTSINQSLKELTHLESLDLNFSECQSIREIDSVDLQKLASLRKLYFDFRMCDNLDESALISLNKTLEGLTSLQQLRIQLAGRLTFNENFQMEIVGGSKIKDQGFFGLMEVLENMRFSLKDLYLNFEICETLSDLHLATLGKCLTRLSALQKLTLNFNKCINLGNEAVLGLSKGLETLVSLQSIYLNFDKCPKLTDEGMSSLARGLKGLTLLEEINLVISSEFDQVAITNQGFLSLCKSLENLVLLRLLTIDFSRAQVCDEDIGELGKSLEELKNLKDISFDFFDCPHVTEEGRENLKRRLERKLSQAVVRINE